MLQINKLSAHRVITELDHRDAAFVRLNTEDFLIHIRCLIHFDKRKTSARLDLGRGRHVVPEALTALWYRRPEPCRINARITDPVARQFAREESNAALRGFLLLSAAARWVNHPDANHSAQYKLVQLAAVAGEGLRTPQPLVTNNPAEAGSFYASLGGAVIAKTVGAAFVPPIIEPAFTPVACYQSTYPSFAKLPMHH